MIENTGSIKFESHVPKEHRELVRWILAKNQQERPNFEEIMNHNLIKDYVS